MSTLLYADGFRSWLIFHNISSQIFKWGSWIGCWEGTARSFHQLLKDVHADIFQHHNLSPSLKLTVYVELSSMQHLSSFLCCCCPLSVVTYVTSASKSGMSALKTSPLLLPPQWATVSLQFNCLWSVDRQGSRNAAFGCARYLWLHSCVGFASIQSVKPKRCLSSFDWDWRHLVHWFRVACVPLCLCNRQCKCSCSALIPLKFMT